MLRIQTGRLLNRPGSWLISAGVCAAGSLLGWGISLLLDGPSTIPAVLLAAAGSSIGYLAWTPPHSREPAGAVSPAWACSLSEEGGLGLNLQWLY